MVTVVIPTVWDWFDYYLQDPYVLVGILVGGALLVGIARLVRSKRSRWGGR